MNDTDTSVAKYMNDVRALPQLDREAEHELAVRWRDTRDPAAADALTRANLRYVVAIALKYKRYGLRVGELIAEGNMGLVTALQKFDPEKGTRFVTYAAYWIRAYVLNYVLRSWSLVGAGSGALRSKMFFQLRRERARLANLTGDEGATVVALAERLKTTPEKLEPMLQRLEARDVSLDVPAFDDSDATRLDLLADDGASQESSLGAREEESLVGGRVRDALGLLDARERYIVEQRMLTDEEVSLAELGRRLGVSRERARQLEVRAHKKLRERLADLEPVLAAA